MEQENYESKRSVRWILVASALIAFFSLYMLLAFDLKPKPMAGQGGSAVGEDVQIGGDFTLTDFDGATFSSQNMQGHFSLVYFGFTYCPDICPTSLNKLSQVIDTLTKYNIKIMPIFITVDPARDTGAVLKEYLGHFSKSFIGLTGTEDQIKKVADLYKVFYSRAAESEGRNYMMDHSSFVYLMGKDSKYMKHFYMTTTPEEMIEYIRTHK